LCEERSQLQTIFQLLGAVKEVVFLTPFPVNVSDIGNFEELVDEDLEGVIEGVSANDLGEGVGIVAWFVFDPWVTGDPRHPAQTSVRPANAAASNRERPDRANSVIRNCAILLSCCFE
jgi:hypothetical protein